MATYNNQFASKINITPANPNLRGLEDNFSNDGQRNLGGEGLGNIYQLDYDRNAIENIFNQGTDAQYALMQKEARVAENNYANQQFQAQQDTLNTLRAQRNEQIASGMARGLNAAADQATALGIQQESMNGALELAQNRQMQADQIAAEYANNVVKALQESNAVKQAMAQVAAQLYEADMLGYTGELSTLGQLDANAVNKYASELGLEGTKYSADKTLEGTKYNADKNYEGTVYNADKNYAAQVKAASITAAAYKSSGNYSNSDNENFIQQCYKTTKSYEGMVNALQYDGRYTPEQAQRIARDFYNQIQAETTTKAPLVTMNNGIMQVNPVEALKLSDGLTFRDIGSSVVNAVKHSNLGKFFEWDK